MHIWYLFISEIWHSKQSRHIYNESSWRVKSAEKLITTWTISKQRYGRCNPRECQQCGDEQQSVHSVCCYCIPWWYGLTNQHYHHLLHLTSSPSPLNVNHPHGLKPESLISDPSWVHTLASHNHFFPTPVGHWTTSIPQWCQIFSITVLLVYI